MQAASRVFLYFIFASVLLIRPLAAQDDFQKWLQKDRQQYENFLSAEDKAFANFLKQTWQPFESKKGKKRDAQPKPVKLPVAPRPQQPKVKQKTTPEPVIELPPPPPPVIEPKPEPKSPKRVVDHQPVKAPKNVLKFTYLDLSLAIESPGRIKLQVPNKLSNGVFSAAWQKLASRDHSKEIQTLNNFARDMNLNDWGRMQMTLNYVQTVYPDDGNRQRILLWFLLNKTGIDARVAFSKATVYVLFPASDALYGNDFVKINGQNYYFLKDAHHPFRLDKQVYTYKKTYSKNNKPVSLRVPRVPHLQGKTVTKKFSFTFRGKEVTVPVTYSADVVRFFKKYPQTQLQVYFGAPVSDPARSSLLSALRPFVENKSQEEAVNFILRFVQTAFDYKTDDQQFGREKYLMPEETLFYPSSDCEDRSILFSYLVKNLLGMEVVGLDYPGHVATAVRFDSPLKGTAVKFRGKSFLICDPTYVNADAGMCMPQFQQVTPKVIDLL